MGTYKHIGRIRSARVIGRDLAAFYLQLGEMQKAAMFLADALKTFEEENWRHLALQTQFELAECYRKMGDKKRWVSFKAILSCLFIMLTAVLVCFGMDSVVVSNVWIA